MQILLSSSVCRAVAPVHVYGTKYIAYNVEWRTSWMKMNSGYEPPNRVSCNPSNVPGFFCLLAATYLHGSTSLACSVPLIRSDSIYTNRESHKEISQSAQNHLLYMHAPKNPCDILAVSYFLAPGVFDRFCHSCCSLTLGRSWSLAITIP